MDELIKILNNEEAKAEAKFILHSLGIYEKVLLGENIPEIAFEIAKKRAKSNIPIQYIVGFVDFMNLKFKVNQHVLIPRDETEFLIKETQKIITSSKNNLKILDIGTGSGIIPIILAKTFGTKIQALAVDISIEALEVAIENAQANLEPNIVLFRKSDLFSNVEEKFDIIISNPPYIPPQNRDSIQKELLYEPQIALFTNDDKGVEFYEKIISQAINHLNPKGHILFELGINQSGIVYKMLEDFGFKNITIIKDLAGIERVIVALYM